MKKAILVVVLALILSLFVSAGPFSYAVSDGESGCEPAADGVIRETIDAFLAAYPFGKIDAATVEIKELISITRLGKEDHQYFSVYVEDGEKSPAYFMIDATDGMVVEFAEGPSPFSAFTDLDGEFLYEPLGYYLKTEDGKVYDLSAEDVFGSELQPNPDRI